MKILVALIFFAALAVIAYVIVQPRLRGRATGSLHASSDNHDGDDSDGDGGDGGDGGGD